MKIYPYDAADMREVDGELWNALIRSSPHAVEESLKNGANPNARWTGQGTTLHRPTPLCHLLQHTQTQWQKGAISDARKMLLSLLTHGADPTIAADGVYPFQLALPCNHPACTVPMHRHLLRGIDKDLLQRAVDHKGEALTPLLHAFSNRSVSLVRVLLSKGIDPSQPMDDGQPAWMALCRRGRNTDDYHRHPQAAQLARELARAGGSEAALQAVEREADLLREDPRLHDSYGQQAFKKVVTWLGVQGELDLGQRNRLLACSMDGVDLPWRDMAEKGIDPNITTRAGVSLPWLALKERNLSLAGMVFEHADTDLTVRSDSGDTLVDGLLPINSEWLTENTRKRWLSRVEHQLLSQPAAGQPPTVARRMRL